MLNEFNELQTTRLIRPDLTLIAYAIIMEGFGLKYWTSYDPDLDTTPSMSPDNYVLYFFVTTILIYLIGAV